MTHVFRSGNPGVLVWLVLYALVMKIFFLIQPLPLPSDTHAGIVYNFLIRLLQQDLHWGKGHFQWIAFLLLMILALQLNQLLTRYRLLPGRNYYPAMTFLLLSTFQPAWNQLSAAMVACCFLIPALSTTLHPDVQAIQRAQLYQAGFWLGIGSLLYPPIGIFLCLLWLMMLVNRPFRLAEWLLVLVGWLTPLYFLMVGRFLVNQLSWTDWKIRWQFYLDLHWLNQWMIATIVVMGLLFVVGFGLILYHLSSMLIQVRKSWILLLVAMGIAMAEVMWTGFSIVSWLPLVLFIAAFASNIWWYMPARKWAWTVNMFHLLLIVLAWAMIYLPQHQPNIQFFRVSRHF